MSGVAQMEWPGDREPLVPPTDDLPPDGDDGHDMFLVRELLRGVYDELDERGTLVTSYVVIAGTIDAADGSMRIRMRAPKESPYWVDAGLLRQALKGYDGMAAGVVQLSGGEYGGDDGDDDE